MKKDIGKLDPKHYIIIKGAKTHNLKGLDVAIPRNKFVVITGLSGSGKSSLAFDTLFAEGQRRYVESLSAYARQFLGRLEKPPVEYIKGISPAIAIEQKVSSRNPRSTVGTTTEIYDYLKLLFARIGKTFSPISGQQVKRHTVSNVVDEITGTWKEKKVLILSRIFLPEKRTLKQQLDLLSKQGFSRVFYKKEILRIDDEKISTIKSNDGLFLLVDRISIDELSDKEETSGRIADSVQIAFSEGNGECFIYDLDSQKLVEYSNRFELDGMEFEDPNPNFFAFNNPVGACKTCEGFGSIIGIDPNLVIPNKNLSLFDNAVACWNGESMSWYKNQFIKQAHKFNFPVHKPIKDLTKNQYKTLWDGNEYVDGLNAFFKQLEKESYKIQYRVMLARYRGKTECPDCLGTRLRKDANYVKVGGISISELVLMPVEQALIFFKNLALDAHDTKIANRLLIEIKNRLSYLCEVGLGYLTLNRVSNSLSGGESQRINLATSLASNLVGSMYILDEPSIGLHSRDTERLIGVLRNLQKLGNTVIVVEHDEDIMHAADEIIDIGPMAGSHGGEVVFQGTNSDLLHSKISYTAKYLTGREKIEIPFNRRKGKKFIQFHNANENNLKNVEGRIPLQTLCAVTGVSGSGKSTLVKKIIYPNIRKALEGYFDTKKGNEYISGDLTAISAIEFVDQNPIGKSSRSNPVTYVKAFDEIRNLFAEQPLAKTRGYKSGHFSFNVEGGRCEVCQGEGQITVEMQFMADIQLICENCNGKRFKSETLEINFRGKNIADILELTIDDAIDFFENETENKICKKIIEKLKPLQDVGLGYVQMGQSSSTLSGGEAQRIKLASFLLQGNSNTPTLFIFDEPTTGLHFHDVKKLLKSFELLLNNGHSIIVIEHNLDIIKCADWIIDLGPEGGDKGGEIIFEGEPEELVRHKKSITGKYLKEKLIQQPLKSV